jgi:hypothetical protein
VCSVRIFFVFVSVQWGLLFQSVSQCISLFSKFSARLAFSSVPRLQCPWLPQVISQSFAYVMVVLMKGVPILLCFGHPTISVMTSLQTIQRVKPDHRNKKIRDPSIVGLLSGREEQELQIVFNG